MLFPSDTPLLRYIICLKIMFSKLVKKILAPFLLSLIAAYLDSHSFNCDYFKKYSKHRN